jgi:cell shape-determining protein MreC
MTIKVPRSRPFAGRRGLWQRVAFAFLPIIALVLLLLPQSQVDWLRLRLGPVFSPLGSMGPDNVLDLDGKFDPLPNSPGDREAVLRQKLAAYQRALVEMQALLDEADRRVADLSRIREGLHGLPCRLTPARFLAPEVAGAMSVGRLSEGSTKGVRKPGAVIVRPTIDRGTREDIEHGNPVLMAAGLVGVIEEVGPVTSTVKLVTDSRLNLMVQIVVIRDGHTLAGPEGMAKGSDDGLSVVVQGLPRDSDIQVGDFVVTSPSRESPLPPYLVIGRVKVCNSKPASPFRSVVVTPAVSADEVRQVYVLSPDAAAGPAK